MVNKPDWWTLQWTHLNLNQTSFEGLKVHTPRRAALENKIDLQSPILSHAWSPITLKIR